MGERSGMLVPFFLNHFNLLKTGFYEFVRLKKPYYFLSKNGTTRQYCTGLLQVGKVDASLFLLQNLAF